MTAKYTEAHTSTQTLHTHLMQLVWGKKVPCFCTALHRRTCAGIAEESRVASFRTGKRHTPSTFNLLSCGPREFRMYAIVVLF